VSLTLLYFIYFNDNLYLRHVKGERKSTSVASARKKRRVNYSELSSTNSDCGSVDTSCDNVSDVDSEDSVDAVWSSSESEARHSPVKKERSKKKLNSSRSPSKSRKRKGNAKSYSSDASNSKEMTYVSTPFWRKVMRSYRNLDMRLWHSGYSVSERKNRFASINHRLKSIITAEYQCIVRQPSRVNYSWEDMFNKWLNHAEKYPSRKNRVPLEKTRLSNWVHEQRKAFRVGSLSEYQRELLALNDFDFHPRKTFAELPKNRSSSSRSVRVSRAAKSTTTWNTAVEEADDDNVELDDDEDSNVTESDAESVEHEPAVCTIIDNPNPNEQTGNTN